MHGPILEVHLAWHPGDRAAERLAGELDHHFHDGVYGSLLGGTMEFAAVRPGDRRPGNRVQLVLPVVSRVEADAQRPPPGGGRSVGL